jgi:hypothetical protein
MRPSDRSPKCRNQNPSNSLKVRTKRRRVRKTLLSRSWSKLLTVAKSLIMALHTRTTPKPHFRSTTTTNPETASLNSSSSSKEVSRSSIDHRTTIDNHITRISLRTSSSSTTLKRSRSTQPNTSHLTRSTLLPSSSNTMR